jgi:octaprenyl-diphosphate synthase
MTSLSNIQKSIASELEAMNNIISDSLRTSNPLMNEVVSHYLKTKGKQIRPIIVILSAKMFGEVNDHVLHAGAALEMLHNASLIHDDVIDETMLRRNTPTVNSLWGNHLAVLVGDFFVSNALGAGIKTGNINVIAALSGLGIELSIGEVDQINNARNHYFKEEAYLSMIKKKTASLFMNCLRIGAETSGAEESEWSRMIRFAELLGICFQIKDDIFDYFDNAEIGKPTGNDLREGKVSLPLLYALSNAPEEKAAKMRNLLSKATLSEEDIHTLIQFAIDGGGIEYSFSRMREMQLEANAILDSYPPSDASDAFRSIFEFIISRNN